MSWARNNGSRRMTSHADRSWTGALALCRGAGGVCLAANVVANLLSFKRRGIAAILAIRLDRRALAWINVTTNPTAEWIARQITEAFPWNEAPRYLIRDRDARLRDLKPELEQFAVDAARSLGVPVRRTKMQALALSAAFTSVAGSLYVIKTGFIDPDSAFGILISVQMVISLPNGRGSTRYSAFRRTDPAFEPSLRQHRSPLSGNAICGAETKAPNRPLKSTGNLTYGDRFDCDYVRHPQ